MKFRKLRIAWSVFWGVACLLLIVLWVRSYWWMDMYVVQISKSYAFDANDALGRASLAIEFSDIQSYYTAHWLTRDDYDNWTSAAPVGFAWGKNPRGIFIIFPFWLAASIAASLGISPWMRWRFKLRTLLIAIMLVVVVLGLAVYTAQK